MLPVSLSALRGIIKDLILFLDSSGIHHLNGVTADLMSRFTETMIGLAPVTIAERLSALRQYFKYAFLHKYVDQPIEVFLPHPPQRLRTKLPTVWSEEQIEQLINSIDITTPLAKEITLLSFWGKAWSSHWRYTFSYVQ